MGLILAALASAAERGRPPKLSEFNKRIPDYVMVKDKIDLPDRKRLTPALKRLKKAARIHEDGPRIDETDGVKIVFEGRWLHVRPSGTEPIARIFAEAPTKKAAAELIAWGGAHLS